MNKSLYILWGVIIVGVIFITINLTSPKPNDTEVPPQDLPTQQEPQPPAENQKTYNEYLNTGNKLFSTGDYTSAATNYLSASKLNPNSSQIFLKLGEAYLRDNNPTPAIDAFTKANQINSQISDGYIGLARGYLNSGKIEEARNIILQLDTNIPEVKYYRALVSILFKDYDGAKNLINEIVTANPPVEEPLLSNAKKYQEKFTAYSYFKEGSPLYLETLLAKAMTETGQYAAASPLLYDVLNQKSSYRDAWIVLGYAYLNLNKISDAIDALTQAYILDESKPETSFYLGLAFFANNNLEKAVYYLNSADQKGYEPKDLIKSKLGDIYLLQKNYEKSAENYKSLLSLNATNLDVFIRLIWLDIETLNDPQDAILAANRAIENFPNSAMSYNLKGWALTAAGNLDEAKKYLAKAIGMDPKLDAVHLNLGWLYEKEGSISQAKESYKMAYLLGKGNSIGKLATIRFNNLNQGDQNQYYQTNISAP